MKEKLRFEEVRLLMDAGQLNFVDPVCSWVERSPIPLLAQRAERVCGSIRLRRSYYDCILY
jgi:hypothetical protein